jgi:hypothetical protein
MAWGALNVGEQRARLVARPATGALLAPSQRHFLIANLELKFHLSHSKTSPLKISNRKKNAVFLLTAARRYFSFPQHQTPKPVSRHPAPSWKLQVKLLIETPRLEIRITSRKQNQSQFLIEANQALCAAGSSLHGPPAAPASPQAMPRSATTLRPFPPLW